MIDFGAQIVAHGFGDYVLQSHWMATEKTKHWTPAIWHGIMYGMCFVFLGASLPALICIVSTHIIIDKYRLAKYLVWMHNQIAPLGVVVERNFDNFGFPQDTPVWLAFWLMIILDNLLHITINVISMKIFPN